MYMLFLDFYKRQNDLSIRLEKPSKDCNNSDYNNKSLRHFSFIRPVNTSWVDPAVCAMLLVWPHTARIHHHMANIGLFMGAME